MDTVNTELIRGHVDTIILNSLAERDRYGYEILDIISDLSEGRYEIKQPTLYSCLKRLEKQGFIDSYFGDESNGGRRRYYKLTDKGKETLEQDQREWEFSRTIINRLLSDKEIALKTVEAPFDPNELRPLTRRVKAHDVSEEVASAVAPVQSEPVVKYVYIPQYIHVPQGNPLPENGVLPEGASFASEQEIPEEVKNSAPVVEIPKEPVAPIERSYFSFPFAQAQEEEIVTPTEQEALDALYSSVITKSQVAENDVSEQKEAEEPDMSINKDDEEAALIVKEQQTKASRLLGIGEFALPRNLLADDREEESARVESVSKEIENTAKQEQNNENINYRETLSAFFGTSALEENAVKQASATHQAEVERLENTAKARHFGDVKQSLYEDGFKLKVYQKANTINHYYMKFIYSNRINRDATILTYLVLLAELLAMIIARKVFGNPLTYVIIGAIGVLIPLIPTLVCILNPTKRIRAQFKFNQALANSFIAFIVISAVSIVVCLLLDVNMKSGLTYAPVIIASNIPVGVAIYGVLYKSNNYHLKKY